MKEWKCAACGYEFSAEDQPENCPACGVGRDRIEAVDNGEQQDGGTAEGDGDGDAAAAAGGDGAGDKKWKCTICNYIHTGPEPPDECPICGADSSYFVEVTEEGGEEDERGEKEPQPETGTGEGAAKRDAAGKARGEESARKEKKPFGLLGALVIRLNLHPISVHTPNGVLPPALVFLLLAVSFQYWLLEWASFFNYIVVFLSMPVVFATGFIAWKRKYNGAMTWIFKTKLACTAVVAVLVSLLVFWRLIDADVAHSGDIWAWTYIGLGVVAVVAAGIAGHLGGKLVFRNH